MDVPHLNLAFTPTPLHKLQWLSDQVGRNIWIKRDDLTGFAVSGNKVRKLEFCLAQAKAEGADVILTCGGLQSNHCRATAILGAQLGFKVHLLLRGEEPQSAEGNLFLDRLAGAEISYFARRYYEAHLDFIVEEIRQQYLAKGLRPYFITTGASDEVGVWGYYRAAAEIKQDCERLGIQPTHVVVATGSGGTQAGLTAGVLGHQMSTQVTGYAVCDDADFFGRKVYADIRAWDSRYRMGLDLGALQIKVQDDYIGEGYGIASPPIFATIADLLRNEGVLLDPVYTGKAFYGMLRDLEQGYFGDSDDILFVHTGGAFGLMAQHRECLQNLS